MNVSLTPYLENLVREKVATGQYNSASEVVRDALRLLEERDQIHTLKLERLRSQIIQGIDDLDAGRSVTFDPDEIIRRGRNRSREREA